MATSLKERVETWKEANPLRQWRASEGLSIHDAASLLGVGPFAIQSWESGAQTPNPESRERLTAALGRDAMQRWDTWLEARPTVARPRRSA